MRLPIFGLMVVLCCLFCQGSCDHEDWEDPPGGLGWTGDVGIECDIACYGRWCESEDVIECRSGFCIGRPERLYCSVPCDLDIECPEGYSCTEECTKEVAGLPVCVSDEDLSLLRELEFCP